MERELELEDKTYIVFQYTCYTQNCSEFQEAYNNAYKIIPAEAKLKEGVVIKFTNPTDNIIEVIIYQYKGGEYLLFADRSIERTTKSGKIIVVRDDDGGLSDIVFHVEAMLKTAIELYFMREFGFDEPKRDDDIIIWENEVVAFVTDYRVDWRGNKKKFAMMKVDNIEVLVGYIEANKHIRAEIHASYYALLIEEMIKKRYVDLRKW